MSGLVKRLRVLQEFWNRRDALTRYMAVEMAVETVVVSAKSADALEAQARRITELEASLADSNEALQVMGLKLAHAEADRADFMEIAKERSARCVQLAEHRSQLAAQLQSHSANTVVGPTPVMDAAPAWEMMAIAWLRGKAAGQAQNNERWPDHAKCYPRWTLYVDIAQELANELEREHQKREDTRTAGESDS